MSNLQHLALFMFLIFLPAGRSLKTILKRKLLFDVIFHRVIPDMHKDFREKSLHTFPPVLKEACSRLAVSIGFIYFNNDMSTDECCIIFFQF